ncbi:hypothetical protein FOA52_010482 [Chlamydomonas sp. UWO 241]|nr:hypothetical protein FOA52_010482 [Chlamydomonas sp. UWO 241]
MGKRKQPVEVEEPAEDEDLEAEAGDSGGGESGEGESEDEDTSGTDSGSSDGEGDDDDDSLPDESADEEDGDVDEDGVPTTAKEIVVNFNFRSPEEIDFLGLRSLLGSYHDGGTYDVSGLVNAVLEQDHVGSVVKAAEGDDPIAVFTVLNTLTHKDQDWLKQTAEWLAAHCKDADAKRKLAAALAAPGTGLLLNERLINCPPKIAPPLMQFLFSEVAEAAAEKGPDGDEFKLKASQLCVCQ